MTGIKFKQLICNQQFACVQDFWGPGHFHFSHKTVRSRGGALVSRPLLGTSLEWALCICSIYLAGVWGVMRVTEYSGFQAGLFVIWICPHSAGRQLRVPAGSVCVSLKDSWSGNFWPWVSVTYIQKNTCAADEAPRSVAEVWALQRRKWHRGSKTAAFQITPPPCLSDNLFWGSWEHGKVPNSTLTLPWWPDRKMRISALPPQTRNQAFPAPRSQRASAPAWIPLALMDITLGPGKIIELFPWELLIGKGSVCSVLFQS